MDPSTTILRVKRKRGTDPADALLLACKRIRPEATAAQPSDESEPEPQEPEIENSVFKLVATVVSQVMSELQLSGQTSCSGLCEIVLFSVVVMMRDDVMTRERTSQNAC